jgi:hypothetical protein
MFILCLPYIPLLGMALPHFSLWLLAIAISVVVAYHIAVYFAACDL